MPTETVPELANEPPKSGFSVNVPVPEIVPALLDAADPKSPITLNELFTVIVPPA